MRGNIPHAGITTGNVAEQEGSMGSDEKSMWRTRGKIPGARRDNRHAGRGKSTRRTRGDNRREERATSTYGKHGEP